jgi:hypothetical protein
VRIPASIQNIPHTHTRARRRAHTRTQACTQHKFRVHTLRCPVEDSLKLCATFSHSAVDSLFMPLSCVLRKPPRSGDELQSVSMPSVVITAGDLLNQGSGATGTSLLEGKVHERARLAAMLIAIDSGSCSATGPRVYRRMQGPELGQAGPPWTGPAHLTGPAAARQPQGGSVLCLRSGQSASGQYL